MTSRHLYWVTCSMSLSLNVRFTTVQYIPRNMHTVFALLCFVVVIHWLIFPYPSGLLHWHCGNLTIAPVPAKQPWWIWINTSCEFIMNDCITTTKQSTTKPCAYFLGYTVPPFSTTDSHTPGPRLNIKTVLSTYGDFHVKDKTASYLVRPCFLLRRPPGFNLVDTHQIKNTILEVQLIAFAFPLPNKKSIPCRGPEYMGNNFLRHTYSVFGVQKCP